jgi:hypothetical protein
MLVIATVAIPWATGGVIDTLLVRGATLASVMNIEMCRGCVRHRVVVGVRGGTAGNDRRMRWEAECWKGWDGDRERGA